MAQYSKNIQNVGTWGNSVKVGQGAAVLTPHLTDVAISSNEYPTAVAITGNCIVAKGNDVGTGAYEICLCDANGNNRVVLKSGIAAKGGGANVTTGGTECAPFTAYISGTALKGKTLAICVVSTGGSFLYWRGLMTVTAYTSPYEFNVSVTQQTGGSCSASKSKATPGSEVTLTISTNTGYSYDGFTLNGENKTGKKFTMPAADVTIVPKFTQNTYNITTPTVTGGTCVADRSTAHYGDTVTLTPVASAGYTYAGFKLNGTTKTGTTFTMPAANAKVEAIFTRNSYAITLSSQTGGSCTASSSAAGYGDTITLYPEAEAGYTYAGFTLDGTAMTGTTFKMPNAAVTVVALFTRNGYAITLASSPEGAGLVTADQSTAGYGDTVTLSQTPAAGYYFDGWITNPAVEIDENGEFSMPNSAITITAKYKHRSTASLGASSMTGGGTVALNITTESTAYTHKYQLSFGTGMETAETDIAAGVVGLTISIPESWSDAIPNAVQKTDGTLVLKTYSGTTLIGSYTITGLTYLVPASCVPILTDPVTEIARTIDGTTYANVDETIDGETVPHYVQSHCGVRTTASASGQRSATIENITVRIGGYTGNRYQKVQTGGSVDFTSGLLHIAGQTVITVTATDSRGRTATKTVTINVEQYNNPTGSLSVKRVDINRDEDPNGEYALYEKTSSFSQIGTNSLTVTLSCGTLGYETNPPASGDLLPNSRKQFFATQEYTISLILEDAFEKTTITAKLPSGFYIIYVTQDGKGLAFMKAVTKTPPAGKSNVLEISGDTQIYYGNDTLEDYIRDIVQNM